MAKRRKKGAQKGRPKPRPAAAEPGARAAQAPRWQVPALAAILVVAAAAAYWNSMQGVFVYDSVDSIRDNPHIRKLWPPSDAISLPLWDKGHTVSGRPVVSFSLALNHALLGPAPWGYHLVNLFIHIGAGLLLFGIVRRTCLLEPFRPRWGRAAPWLAAAVALTWLVHPLTTAAVTYVVQRAESLMGLCYLLTLYCCVRGFTGGGKGWYVAAVVACALGMGAKEVMFTAPVVVLVYDLVFVSRSFVAPFRRRWGLYLGLAATWVISVGLFAATLGDRAGELQALSPVGYAQTQAGVIVHYLRLSFWPYPLVMDYNWPAAETAAQIVLPGLVVVGLLGLTAWGIARRRWFGFVGAWFFLILAPASSIVPIPQNCYEHRMYLSLAGVVALVVILCAVVLRRLARKWLTAAAPALAAVLALAVAGTLGYVTHQRNSDYHTSHALWAQNVEHRPESFMAQNGLGLVLFDNRQFEQAEQRFREAIRRAEAVKYEFTTGHVNLANALMELGRFEEAETALGRAMAAVKEIGPRHRDAISTYNTAAALLIRKNNWRGARTYFEKSLAVDPDRPTTLSGLGVTLAYLDKFDEAVRCCERALEIRRGLGITRKAHESFDALGRVLSLRGRPGDLDRARTLYEKAVALEPRSDGGFNNLGKALFGLKRIDEAAAQFRTAIRINPRNYHAHHNLGQVLKRDGNVREAEEQFRRAIALNPRYPEARHSLGLLLLQRQDLDGAERSLREAVDLEPRYHAAWTNLGVVYLRRALPLQKTRPSQARACLEQAVQHFRQALAVDSSSPIAHNAHTNLGICLLGLGKPREAIAAQQAALRLMPGSAVVLRNLAQAHAATGEFRRAADLATRALGLLTSGQTLLKRQIEADLGSYKARIGAR